MQKGQKEQKHASARCRKAKKSKNTLLHGAERAKRGKTRFCTARKGQKEKKHASALCRKVKKRKNTLLHGAERPKREKLCFCVTQKGQKEELRRKKWLSKVLKKSFVLLQVVVRLPQRRMNEGDCGIVVIALFLYRKKAPPGEVDAGEA